ncbi:MAG: polyhydroxyalkanoate synthesis repressor PhaR [Pseudomonadota bacterium]|jgi:polyhydroxyalkanoate synthesis repressor PhaR
MSRRSVDANDDSVRIIKKYPNRRLYDTAMSSYVALADIKQLVMANVSFVVRDAKSGEDLTRSILLQIILEEEAAGTPLLTEPMLANIIRFYGHAMQGYMGTYLERNVQAFMDFQDQFARHARDMGGMRDTGRHPFLEMQEKMTQQMLDAMGLKRK